ncbi:hypothetical protein T4A_9374 [Trichinella pseudospiralis]|uniref:Uncharacterized protein n=1 Tax=Trichinella pseudospiralis TaxID=6337 RepID=A0A0V1DU68_TRIPS|nr:hypothetical protein T4A_9374 [Trichinella pseudospiralis]
MTIGNGDVRLFVFNCWLFASDLLETKSILLAPQLAISFQFAQFRDFSENLISQKMSEFIVDTTSEELGDLCYVFQLSSLISTNHFGKQNIKNPNLTRFNISFLSANGAHLEQKWGYFMGTSDKHQDLNSNYTSRFISSDLLETKSILLAPQLAISFQFAQFRDFSENLISQKMSEFIVDTTSEELGDLCYVFQLSSLISTNHFGKQNIKNPNLTRFNILFLSANGAHLEQKWGYFMGTSDKHQDLNSN